MVEAVDLNGYLPATGDRLGGTWPKSDDLGVWVGTEETGYFINESGKRTYPRDPGLKSVRHTVELIDEAFFSFSSAGPDD